MLRYNSNRSNTTCSLWFYFEDEVIKFNANITNTDGFKSFMYKAKIIKKIIAQPNKNQNNGIFLKNNNRYIIKIYE